MWIKKNIQKNIGFLIAHADMPLVSKTILNTLCLGLKGKKKEIFVPVYKKKFGNPLAFKYSMIKSLKKIKGDKGAKKLIRFNKSKVQLVKIKSKSILIDFDQLKDFQLFFYKLVQRFLYFYFLKLSTKYLKLFLKLKAYQHV